MFSPSLIKILKVKPDDLCVAKKIHLWIIKYYTYIINQFISLFEIKIKIYI